MTAVSSRIEDLKRVPKDHNFGPTALEKKTSRQAGDIGP